MSRDAGIDEQSGVDKGLVAMVLRMSPEERLRANDIASPRTILELKDAYRRHSRPTSDQALRAGVFRLQ
jgi:hypothetical protein